MAFAAYLLLPLIGLAVWRLESVRRLDLPARIAVAFAAGALITGAVMTLMSIAHLRWSRTALVVILAVIALIGVRASRPHWPGVSPGHVGRRAGRPAVAAGTAALLILTLYGLLDARESCGDLHFFWGPKAVRFFREGGISLASMSERMNPGYPPLLPLLYAWSHTLARQFSWFAAVASTALFLFGSVAIVRGTSGDDRGALLMAATLSYTFAVAFAAGGGEPPLVFFETLAIAAMTFIDAPVLVAMGLAGAAMLKIEGATFVIAVVIADLLVRRNLKRTLLIAAPAAALLAAWLGFVKYTGLFELYRGAGMPVYFAALPATLLTIAKAASYDLWGLPWIVPIVLVALGKVRRAMLPLAIAVLTFGAAIFFYIHLPDPTWWILSSAPRVLLTPLTALLIAAVAAWYSPAAHGVVPEGEKAEGSGREVRRHSGGVVDQVRRLQGDRLPEGSGAELQRLPQVRLPLPPLGPRALRAPLR
jgi:hypothetical protein